MMRVQVAPNLAHEGVHDTYYLVAVLHGSHRLNGHFLGLHRTYEPRIYHPVVAVIRRLTNNPQADLNQLHRYLNWKLRMERYTAHNLPLAFGNDGLDRCEVDGTKALSKGPLVSYKIMWLHAVIEQFADM